MRSPRNRNSRCCTPRQTINWIKDSENMSLTFTLLHPVFAAECSGVDISKPISPEIAAEIEAGMDRYAVLVFRRDTPLTTDEQIRFTESLGDLEPLYIKLEAKGGAR